MTKRNRNFRIRLLHKEGFSLSRLGRIFGIPRQNVYAIINHEKARAGTAARRILDITGKSCEMCGKPAEVRHHDDYSKPLDVRLLCRRCHREIHASEQYDAPTETSNDSLELMKEQIISDLVKAGYNRQEATQKAEETYIAEMELVSSLIATLRNKEQIPIVKGYRVCQQCHSPCHKDSWRTKHRKPRRHWCEENCLSSHQGISMSNPWWEKYRDNLFERVNVKIKLPWGGGPAPTLAQALQHGPRVVAASLQPKRLAEVAAALGQEE